MTRPRLQLHLSTLLIVTVLAGVLLYLNMNGQFPFKKADNPNSPMLVAWNRWTFLLNIIACLAILTAAAIANGLLPRRVKRSAP